jgi:hypothetical protein
VTRYLVEIQAAHVPSSLAGAPLPVEIFAEDGRASRTMLQLSGEPVRQEVSKGGSYLVRTTLPSGRVISSVAETPANADETGVAVGRTVIDLEETDAVADFWREAGSFIRAAATIQGQVKEGAPVPAWFGAWAQELLGRTKDNLGELARSAASYVLEKIGVGTFARPRGGDAAASGSAHSAPSSENQPIKPFLIFQAGRFAEWKPRKEFSGATIVFQSTESGSIGPDGKVPVPAGWSKDVLYLTISYPGQSNRSLMVWRPGPRKLPAQLGLDRSTMGYRSGSILSAFPNPEEDPMTAALFEFVRRGAFEEARVSLEAMISSLKNAYAEGDPNRGVLAGYVLHKLGHSFAEEFIPKLSESDPDIADVHVLNCVQSIAAGKSDEALKSIGRAIDRGIPVYTEGIRLLRDGANLLRDLRPDDEEAARYARQASTMAAAANFDSTLSCLKIGLDLSVEFSVESGLPHPLMP